MKREHIILFVTAALWTGFFFGLHHFADFVGWISCAHFLGQEPLDGIWYPLHFMGGSVAWTEFQAVAVVNTVLLLFRVFRRMVIALCCWTMLPWFTVYFFSSHLVDNPVLHNSAAAIVLFHLLTIWLLLRKPIKNAFRFQYNANQASEAIAPQGGSQPQR